jgi:hypothetical protein
MVFFFGIRRGVDGPLELRDRAVRANAPFKAHNYEVAIRSIETHPTPVRSGEEASVLPGIGPKTAEKIQEIIDTVIHWGISLNAGHSKTVGG